jgi:hypothetical protein
MSDQSQISATVSAATKEELDQFTERHGLKKNFVVEQALLYFMEARRDLPDEAFIPTRLVLEEGAFDQLVAIDQRDRLGCIGVVTDAKPDAIGFYESLGSEPLIGVREGVLHGEPTPMFLPIDTVASALGG